MIFWWCFDNFIDCLLICWSLDRFSYHFIDFLMIFDHLIDFQMICCSVYRCSKHFLISLFNDFLITLLIFCWLVDYCIFSDDFLSHRFSDDVWSVYLFSNDFLITSYIFLFFFDNFIYFLMIGWSLYRFDDLLDILWTLCWFVLTALSIYGSPGV